MGDIGMHLGRAVLQQDLSRLAQRAGGVADVIHDDALLARHIADHRHAGHFARLLAALVHNGQRRVDPLGQFPRPRHTADVGGDHHQIVHLVLEMVLNVQSKDRAGVKVVHRNIKEPLNLRRVQVQRQHPVHPGLGQQVCHQLGRDRRARLGAAVLAGITEIGDHSGDAVRARPAQRVTHDEQFHQVVIRRRRGGLDDIHILAAHVFEHLDKDLAVVETLHPCIHQIDAHPPVHRHAPGDALGQ